ncbi:hypothetical protein CYMTET_36560, partial [Cymbomonas tetramitiformis]
RAQCTCHGPRPEGPSAREPPASGLDGTERPPRVPRPRRQARPAYAPPSTPTLTERASSSAQAGGRQLGLEEPAVGGEGPVARPHPAHDISAAVPVQSRPPSHSRMSARRPRDSGTPRRDTGICIDVPTQAVPSMEHPVTTGREASKKRSEVFVWNDVSKGRALPPQPAASPATGATKSGSSEDSDISTNRGSAKIGSENSNISVETISDEGTIIHAEDIIGEPLR